MAVSQNGYRVIAPDDINRLTRLWIIPGNSRDITLRLKAGPVGLTLAHFALFFDREIENIEELADDHAWSYRQISGSDEWSNHASATALDLNATKHPQGRWHTFTSTQQLKMLEAIEGRYQNCIRAGFTYRTTPDDMHFEINAGPTTIDELAVGLYYSPRGEKLRKANPWFKWTPEEGGIG